MWIIVAGAKRQEEQEVLSQVGRQRATPEEMRAGILACQERVTQFTNDTVRGEYERILAHAVVPR